MADVAVAVWGGSPLDVAELEQGALDLNGGDQIGLVVETGCRYFAEMAFPDVVTAGVGRAGDGRIPADPTCHSGVVRRYLSLHS